MRILLAIPTLLLCHAATAQTFKCTDKAGKTTYSSQPCNELGLKDAGPIQDRVQITPAFQPPPPPPEEPRRPQAAKPPAAAEAPKEAKEPERRCFTVTTASGGKVTRCNDKPDEKAD